MHVCVGRQGVGLVNSEIRKIIKDLLYFVLSFDSEPPIKWNHFLIHS